MRILVTIPHYFKATGGKAADGREHGSVAVDPRPRLEALASCLAAWHQLFSPPQAFLDHARKTACAVAPGRSYHIDIVICTTQHCHLLKELEIPVHYFQEHATEAEPMLLGFECHAVLRERLGKYDYYCYLEDDLIVHDPWLLRKLAWFSNRYGDDKLLQPNRFECGLQAYVRKAYVDGKLREEITAPMRTDPALARLTAEVLGEQLVFEQTLNPHAGCFFLNARQMAQWAQQPYFLDRDIRFIGPLESAATLGIVRTFKIYKPAMENADFLEIQHYGTGYLEAIVPGTAPS
jgi:hypothetical protein